MRASEKAWLINTVKELANDVDYRKKTEQSRNYSYVLRSKSKVSATINDLLEDKRMDELSPLDIRLNNITFTVRTDILRILDILAEHSELDEDEIVNLLLLYSLKNIDEIVNKRL